MVLLLDDLKWCGNVLKKLVEVEEFLHISAAFFPFLQGQYRFEQVSPNLNL